MSKIRRTNGGNAGAIRPRKSGSLSHGSRKLEIVPDAHSGMTNAPAHNERMAKVRTVIDAAKQAVLRNSREENRNGRKPLC